MRSLLIFALPLLASAGPYVATIEKVSGTVGFYSESGQNEGRVKVGAFPHEAVLSRDGKLLFVSNNGVLWMTEDTMGTNSISVVDVSSKKKLYDIDLGRFHRPHGLALIPKTGHLLVTTERPYGLILVDPAKRTVVRDFDVKGKSPHMVMLSSDGNLAFVSNTDSASVAVIEVATGAVRLIPTGEKPQGGAFSKDGKLLYVATSGANCITIVDTKTFQVIGTIATGKGPGRIAVTPDGKTLVYNMQLEPALGFADISTRKQTTVIPLPGKPLSLTMTNDGRRAFSGLQELDKVVFISVVDRKIERTIDTPKSSGPDPVIPLGSR